jgi:hypothetical protein
MGHAPFAHKEPRELLPALLGEQYSFDPALSQEAKIFIRRLLCADPTKRVMAADSLKDLWLLKHMEEDQRAFLD